MAGEAARDWGINWQSPRIHNQTVMSIRRKFVRFLAGTAIVIVMAIAVMYVALLPFMPPTETKDLRSYATARDRWAKAGLAEHFPSVIPATARNVRFSEKLKYLQGGAHIQLRMQLPSADLKKIEDEVKQKALYTYPGGNIFEQYNADQEKNVPTASFFTSDDSEPKSYDFPKHYTMYVLAAKNYDSVWDHYEMRGVAISWAVNEVVYWAEGS